MDIDTIMGLCVALLITGLLLFLLIRLCLNLKNKLERRNFKVPPDFFEKAENFTKSIPEEMVEIRFLTYSFFGIEYKHKMVFKCKICGQVLHPQTNSDGHFARGSWQCPKGCKPKVESKYSDLY